MPFLRNLTIRWKLAFLAGVPVLGALLLSLLIARTAWERAQTAAALGSIQDLADLTQRMTEVTHATQMERAQTALATGTDSANDTAVVARQAETDKALASLDAFLSRRDISRLPSRLARGLRTALDSLTERSKFRGSARGKEFPIEKTLEFYGTISGALISATAALTQLSDDGELLRSISALVATMEVKERASLEHALLANVFALGEFPAGTYRSYLKLITQEEVFAEALRNAATDEQYRLYGAVQDEPAAKRAAALREVAVTTTDDPFGIDPRVWFATDAEKVESLRRVETSLVRAVERAALAKIDETHRSVRVSIVLVGAVVFSSLVLALLIGRGVERSVVSLAEAAAAVRRDRDYGIRAKKVSQDELGTLTDAFNEMLAGIQSRDEELDGHRRNLEALVAERTRELSRRNEDMRVVLDNVDQGLFTVDRAGHLSAERSRAFDLWFGDCPAGAHFADCLVKNSPRIVETMTIAYEQIMEGFLPLDVCIDQMPKRLVVGDSHYTLSFKPLLREDKLDGVLVIVTDITADLQAQAAEMARQEQVKVFEHVMRDRAGFVEFFHEVRRLIELVRDDEFSLPADRLRTVHTIKGNAAIYGVTSVARVAHVLEQALVDQDALAASRETQQLLDTWDAFTTRTVPVIGADVGDRLEITQVELHRILDALRARKPISEVEAMLQRLRLEPIQLRLERIAAQLSSVSKRRNKGEPQIVISSNDVRLPPTGYSRFWGSWSHIVRNIVDHGFETEDTRREQGKSPCNRVELTARSTPTSIEITIADDGRGVDWPKVAEKAASHGLATQTRADLVRALLSPGITTAASVTEESGRGVGLAEVAAACAALSGTVDITSDPGLGTAFRFTLPALAGDPVTTPPRLSTVPVSRRSQRPSVPISIVLPIPSVRFT